MQATWELPDGRKITLDVAEGMNLMQAAVARGIPGVVGECGGSMSCATCHVVVTPDWAERAGPPGPFEEDMLDITEAGRQPASRLSCQIRMTADLDGIVVQVPAV
ncbi:ferredoxin [Tabrizicola sp. TH137]|uniref:2Fe-2S iron-sulfur cluster-binding protein n=1 Tax=Tabrizicola sp. TH137 TaxID=2067452 RepID=UPI000C7DEF1A|nr:2Fe-2S iron-sulfur cluster-binding protein [Tabrizicola sp. TH137]PLL12224.1 ferredoxin [Tabrizicola sp. TH137]